MRFETHNVKILQDFWTCENKSRIMSLDVILSMQLVAHNNSLRWQLCPQFPFTQPSISEQTTNWLNVECSSCMIIKWPTYTMFRYICMNVQRVLCDMNPLKPKNGCFGLVLHYKGVTIPNYSPPPRKYSWRISTTVRSRFPSWKNLCYIQCSLTTIIVSVSAIEPANAIATLIKSYLISLGGVSWIWTREQTTLFSEEADHCCRRKKRKYSVYPSTKVCWVVEVLM